MTVEVLLNVFGHHHPDYMRDAAVGVTSKPRKGVSVVETVVDFETRKRKKITVGVAGFEPATLASRTLSQSTTT